MKADISRKPIQTSLLLLLSFFTLNSCASQLIRQKPLYETGTILSLRKTINLPVGSKIRIRLKNGEVKYGKYLGFQKLTFVDYQDKYEDGKKGVKRKVILPEMNETISLRLHDNSERFAEFLGFDFKTVHIRYLDEPETIILPVGNLENITNKNGYRIEKPILDVLSRIGDIPYSSMLIFREKNASMAAQIGIEKIVHVQYIDRETSRFSKIATTTGMVLIPILTLFLLITI
ncbi:MAG: hypothetical protein DWQ05_13635 [Calditrichaeota bacterium]|nr:MAG: hypothetical protein DWQ05_13635 [Calditrichota bacterium]